LPHRFFVPPHCITPPTVNLPVDAARQVNAVLRMQPGNKICVLDNSGQEWLVELTAVSKKSVQGQILQQQLAPAEPSLHLTLYQGTLKARKFEWVLQKGTELGVSRFVPTICRRSVVRNTEALSKKQKRRQQIIREAAEQSGRGKLPELAFPQTLPQAVARAKDDDLLLMPWEEAAAGSLKESLSGPPVKIVSVFIGPEGGFTPEEAGAVQDAGGQLVTLGPRILRAETASVAVCAAILFEMGEWQ